MNLNKKTFLSSFYPFLFAYSAWISAHYAVLKMGLDFHSNTFSPHFLIIVFIFLCTFSGLLLFSIVFVYTENIFSKNPSVRFFYISAALTLSLVLFLLIKRFGNHFPVVLIVHSANLFVFAVLIGGWLATAVKRPAEIVILCTVLLWVDWLSVLIGPTRYIAATISNYYKDGMAGDIPLADMLLIKTAVPGLSYPYPMFGVSDWIIIVFLSACAAKFKINDNITGKSLGEMMSHRSLSVYLSIPGLGLLISVLAAHFFKTFIPALSIISVIFVSYLFISYGPMIKMGKKDWATILSISLVGMAICFLSSKGIKS